MRTALIKAVADASLLAWQCPETNVTYGYVLALTHTTASAVDVVNGFDHQLPPF
jgi:hypothetical protein